MCSHCEGDSGIPAGDEPGADYKSTPLGRNDFETHPCVDRVEYTAAEYVIIYRHISDGYGHCSRCGDELFMEQL
jgi:hypothetical protein